jgi:hypothetical protein
MPTKTNRFLSLLGIMKGLTITLIDDGHVDRDRKLNDMLLLLFKAFED